MIRNDAFDGMTEDEIVGYLSAQRVLEVKRVMIKREEVFQTRTLFFNFDLLNLPSNRKAGYEIIAVRPYIRAPLTCF